MSSVSVLLLLTVHFQVRVPVELLIPRSFIQTDFSLVSPTLSLYVNSGDRRDGVTGEMSWEEKDYLRMNGKFLGDSTGVSLWKVFRSFLLKMREVREDISVSSIK